MADAARGSLFSLVLFALCGSGLINVRISRLYAANAQIKTKWRHMAKQQFISQGSLFQSRWLALLPIENFVIRDEKTEIELIDGYAVRFHCSSFHRPTNRKENFHISMISFVRFGEAINGSLLLLLLHS